MNIMRDGFSFVYSFRQPYDVSYYQVYFSWHYNDSTTGETYQHILPAINCTTDHYSEDVLARLQQYDLGSGLICPDTTVVQTLVKLIGYKNGTNKSFLGSQVMYCLYEDYCQNQNLVLDYTYYMPMRYITTNTYYDQSDVSQPIKTYIKVSPALYYVQNYETYFEFTIAPSQINFVNGSTAMVYEVKELHSQLFPVYGSNRMIHLDSAYIDPYYVIYQEYYDYQPQVGNDRRQLDGLRNVSFDINSL